MVRTESPPSCGLLSDRRMKVVEVGLLIIRLAPAIEVTGVGANALMEAAAANARATAFNMVVNVVKTEDLPIQRREQSLFSLVEVR